MGELIAKVKRGIGKGVTVAAVKSKEILDAVKIKSQMNNLKGQLEEAFCVLGGIVYQMYVQNGFNEGKIRTKCEIIALLNSQIHEKEVSIKQLHLKAEEALGKSFCSSCESELPIKALYCSNCGEKIDEIDEIDEKN